MRSRGRRRSPGRNTWHPLCPCAPVPLCPSPTSPTLPLLWEGPTALGLIGLSISPHVANGRWVTITAVWGEATMVLMEDSVAVQTELMGRRPRTRATPYPGHRAAGLSGTVRPVAGELGTPCSGSLPCRRGHVPPERPTCSVREWVRNDSGRRAYRVRSVSTATSEGVGAVHPPWLIPSRGIGGHSAAKRRGTRGKERQEGKMLLPKVP